MSAIEFSSWPGRTWSVQLYDPLTGATLGSPIVGVTDGTTPTLYRLSTGSRTGIVYVVGTATNARVRGYANLDQPAATSYSPVLESYADALAAPQVVAPIVTPLDLEQRNKQVGNNLLLSTRERPVFAFNVLEDADGKIPDLLALTLVVIFVRRGSGETVTVPDGSISKVVTKDGSTVLSASVSFRIPAAVSEEASEWDWSLRETANDIDLSGGITTVVWRP